jgi:glycosyltransferase involved in cell wall biosynthesis
LFFGIVRPYKGLNDLLHSLAILKKENYKFLLLIAGEFWEDIKKYKKLIYELQLENNVRIENRYICNEEIGYYFSAADLFIAPYREGTQSASVRLALSYGIPIIISDAIEDDLIVNSGRVEIFERGNIPSLVMTIKKIIGNILSERNQRIKPLNINDTWSSFIDLIQQISFDLRYSIKSDTNLLQ